MDDGAAQTTGCTAGADGYAEPAMTRSAPCRVSTPPAVDAARPDLENHAAAAVALLGRLFGDLADLEPSDESMRFDATFVFAAQQVPRTPRGVRAWVDCGDVIGVGVVPHGR
jgi:hypothetical protein